MRPHALLLCLAACDLPGGDVLTHTPPKGPYTDCQTALDLGQVGEPCSGITACSRTLEPCCTEKLECAGIITSYTRSCDDCQPCAGDAMCAEQTLCLSNRCEPCPRVTHTCPMCPNGLVPFDRNGCSTCDCAPPSSCPSCTPGGTCAPSAYCASGCVGPGCCVEQCSVPGCDGPNPEGCSTDCDGVSCPGSCVATGCTCAGPGWSCTPKCLPGAELFTARCKH
ncbi:MAG: hypothetical protein JNK82_06130 [Myxococcaceae bacterium]|nr:hypothetical protein [Myxococcaceae bacterium]